MKPPAGYEFTGEVRFPQPGEWYLHSKYGACLAYYYIGGVAYHILRPIEAPAVATTSPPTWLCAECAQQWDAATHGPTPPPALQWRPDGPDSIGEWAWKPYWYSALGSFHHVKELPFVFQRTDPPGLWMLLGPLPGEPREGQ